MNWTKKKKMQTAAVIVLAVGFAAGGLTVYSNGLNQQAQVIFTGGAPVEAQERNNITDMVNPNQGDETSIEQTNENATSDSGGEGVPADEQNEAEAEEAEPKETDLTTVSEPAEPTAEAPGENKVAVVSSDSLRKAYLSRREETRIVDPSRPMIALTYDDGPYPAVTERILDSLAEHGGRATFFVVGNRVGNFAETMNRIVDEGHELGNHSYSHTKFTSLDEEGIFQEVNDTQYVVTYTTGVAPELLRLPYGAKNDLVLETVGMPMIQWSLDTLDWKTRDAWSTINRVLETVKDGDIILMHDLYPATAEASEALIPALIENGYQLVTVSELLSTRGVELDGKTLYYNAPLNQNTVDDSVEQEVERYEEEAEIEK